MMGMCFTTAFQVESFYPSKALGREVIPASAYLLYAVPDGGEMRYTRFEWNKKPLGPADGHFKEDGPIADLVGGFDLVDGFDRDIDAALTWQDKRNVYLFKGDQCLRVAVDGSAPATEAQPIDDNFPGVLSCLGERRIDAALPFKDQKGSAIWFFSGSKCCRYSSRGTEAAKEITEEWGGLTWRDDTHTVDYTLTPTGVLKDSGYLVHNNTNAADTLLVPDQYVLCTPSTPAQISNPSVTEILTGDLTDEDGNITWITPRGLAALTVEMWGPGGTGGNSNNAYDWSVRAGGDGGVGAYLRDTYRVQDAAPGPLHFHVGGADGHTCDAHHTSQGDCPEDVVQLVAAGGGHGGGAGRPDETSPATACVGGRGGPADASSNSQAGYLYPTGNKTLRGGSPGAPGNDYPKGVGSACTGGSPGDGMNGGNGGNGGGSAGGAGGNGWDSNGTDNTHDDLPICDLSGGGAGPGTGHGGSPPQQAGSWWGGAGGGGATGSYGTPASSGVGHGGGRNGGCAGWNKTRASTTTLGGGGGGGGNGHKGFGAGGGGGGSSWVIIGAGGGGGSQGWSLLRDDRTDFQACSHEDYRKPYGTPPPRVAVGGAGAAYDPETGLTPVWGSPGYSGAVRLTWIARPVPPEKDETDG